MLEVVLTGTGVPHPAPGRAGAGVLVRYRDGDRRVNLQFDAGRSTVLRLSEAGVIPPKLSAVFLTHLHSDHVIDLADVVITHWVQQQLHTSPPLTIVAPEGPTADFVRHVLDAYDDDLHVRMEHTGAPHPTFDLKPFVAGATPSRV
jgi:ribonuclease Z